MNTKLLSIFLFLLAYTTSMQAGGRLAELSRYFELKPESDGMSLYNQTGEIMLPQEFAERFLIKFRISDVYLKENESLLTVGDALNVKVGNGELQASLALCDSLTGNEPQQRNMTIGAPLSYFDSSVDIHDVALYYNKSHFSIYIDGRLVDNDFPIGSPSVGNSKVVVDCSVIEPMLYVSQVTVKRSDDLTYSDVQYWTPPFHNAWVGDVATCW